MNAIAMKSERGIMIVETLIREGPHTDHTSKGRQKVDKLINTLPRQRIICTIHGSDDWSDQIAAFVIESLKSFEVKE